MKDSFNGGGGFVKKNDALPSGTKGGITAVKPGEAGPPIPDCIPGI